MQNRTVGTHHKLSSSHVPVPSFFFLPHCDLIPSFFTEPHLTAEYPRAPCPTSRGWLTLLDFSDLHFHPHWRMLLGLKGKARPQREHFIFLLPFPLLPHCSHCGELSAAARLEGETKLLYLFLPLGLELGLEKRYLKSTRAPGHEEPHWLIIQKGSGPSQKRVLTSSAWNGESESLSWI